MEEDSEAHGEGYENNLGSAASHSSIIVRCRWRIGSAVWICTVFWWFRAWLRWWGVVDWGGLTMWNRRVKMIRCRNVVVAGVQVGVGRLGENVWRMIWMSWVCTLGIVVFSDVWRSLISGKTSNPSRAWKSGRNGRFKNKWWWWWWNKRNKQNMKSLHRKLKLK